MAGFDRISITRATESIIRSNVDKLYEDEFCFSTDTKKLFIKKNGVLSDLTGLVPSDIINDLTTGGANKVASAETVKNLNQMITLTNSNVNNKLEKGGYTGTANDLKNDIEDNALKIEINKNDILTKLDKTGGDVTGIVNFKSNPNISNSSPAMYYTHTNGTTNSLGNFDGDGILKVLSGDQRGEIFTTGNCPISTSPNGWAKFANGLIIQWGRFNTTYENTTRDIKLNISFSGNYKVMTSIVPVKIVESIAHSWLKDNSNFSCYILKLGSATTIGNSIDWIAVGY